MRIVSSSSGLVRPAKSGSLHLGSAVNSESDFVFPRQKMDHGGQARQIISPDVVCDDAGIRYVHHSLGLAIRTIDIVLRRPAAMYARIACVVGIALHVEGHLIPPGGPKVFPHLLQR